MIEIELKAASPITPPSMMVEDVADGGNGVSKGLLGMNGGVLFTLLATLGVITTVTYSVYLSCLAAFTPAVSVLLTGMIVLCITAFIGKGVRILAA